MRKISIFLLALLLILPICNVQALDVSVRAIKVRESNEYSPHTAWELGYTGRNVVVAIIDAGVDDEHPDLEGKFVAGVDLTVPETPLTPRDGSHNPDDKWRHGTFCAGIVMGTGKDSGGKYMGTAPGAKLVDIKMHRGREPGGEVQWYIEDWNENLINSFEWVIEHKDDFNIRVVSCSKGGGGENSSGDSLVDNAANKAVENGIVVVIAAGNDGPKNKGFHDLVAADGVITVGAVDDRGTVTTSDDIVAEYSNRGPRKDDGDDDPFDELKPEVVAPGCNITSLKYSNGPLPASGYRTSNGTSFSCPHVAGVVALMLEANPDLTPEHVKHILQITAEQKYPATFPDIHPKWNRSSGYGFVDAYEAVKLALETDANSTDPYKIVYISSVKDNDCLCGGVKVSGRAFARRGEIERIEFRVDNRSWTEAKFKKNGKWYNWSIILDTNRYDNGNHTISVRAISGEMHSFEYRVNVVIKNPVREDGAAMSLKPFLACILIATAVCIMGYYENKTKKISRFVRTKMRIKFNGHSM
ncbi:MAG: hypothetical protein DRN20_01040 [Thermoplasmata archaeon]|nr:MAG: hypothetical protein DRN20_01040 [Thermoplasmata archaeon]